VRATLQTAVPDYVNVKRALKYIGMIRFKDNEFDVATATTVERGKNDLGIRL
jgi:hypothetical protein